MERLWRHSCEYYHEWSCNRIPHLYVVIRCQKNGTKSFQKNICSDTQRQKCWQNFTNITKTWSQNAIHSKGTINLPPSSIFNVGGLFFAAKCSPMFQMSTLKLGGRGRRAKIGRDGGHLVRYSNILQFFQNNAAVKVLPTYFVVGCLSDIFSRNCWFIISLASLTHINIQKEKTGSLMTIVQFVTS